MEITDTTTLAIDQWAKHQQQLAMYYIIPQTLYVHLLLVPAAIEWWLVSRDHLCDESESLDINSGITFPAGKQKSPPSDLVVWNIPKLILTVRLPDFSVRISSWVAGFIMVTICPEVHLAVALHQALTNTNQYSLFAAYPELETGNEIPGCRLCPSLTENLLIRIEAWPSELRNRTSSQRAEQLDH